MKILQICLRVPYPPKDGGSIAMHRLTTGLENNNINVEVAAVNTEKHYVDIENLEVSYKTKHRLLVKDINSSVNLFGALTNLFFSKESYNIIRFYDINFENALIEKIKDTKYDLIILESVFMGPYLCKLRKYYQGRIWLRTHNIEYTIWQQHAANCKNFLKKIYLRILAERLEVYEKKLFSEIDGIISIAETDTQFIKASGIKCPIYTLPTGASTYAGLDDTQMEPGVVYHLGSMDWQPNADGMLWFITEVWPKVLNKIPNAKLNLAGRKMPASILDYSGKKNILVYNEIEDARAFEKSKQLMIVPVFAGSGIRIKIIEGLASGKVIISTPLGAQGIPYTMGKDILIASNAEEMTNHITRCLSDQSFCNFISANALLLAKEKFNNTDLCTKFIDYFSEQKI